jgi:hypothetical protein
MPASASSLIVPDQVPSIQQALDAGPDSVLVRPGNYPETPVVYQPGILLMGTSVDSSAATTLAGLRIAIYYWPIYPAIYAFQDLRIINPVSYINDRNSANISFLRCALRGGMTDTTAGFADTFEISFVKCELDSFVTLTAQAEVTLDSCYLTGQVSSDIAANVTMRGCTCLGKRGYTALIARNGAKCTIDANVIRGYPTGVIPLARETTVSNNQIEDCNVGGINIHAYSVTIINNTMARCGYGLSVQSGRSVSIVGNIFRDIPGDGVDVGDGDYVDVSENVFAHCGGSGVVLSQYDRISASVRQNTSCFNGGSGYVSFPSGYGRQQWVGNIGYGNGQFGMSWPVGGAGTLSCNDWFGNKLGTVGGATPGTSDVFVDPQFCGPDSADFHLNSLSPLLADSASCGQIGALGVGCGVTPTLVQRFTAAWMSTGVRVVWEVASGATASEIWVERSEGSENGPWVRPVTERSSESGATVELDRGADPNHAYWYRLMALEGRVVAQIGAPIRVEAQPRLEFRLTEVGPNPGGGLVRIAFALKQGGAIEIDVFDIGGRRIASPARGTWPAGTHEVVWDGHAPNGQPASAGMYVVRYSYPGGQDRRTIVRIR